MVDERSESSVNKRKENKMKWTCVELYEGRKEEFSRWYAPSSKVLYTIPRNKLPKYIQEAMALLDVKETIDGVGIKFVYEAGLYCYQIRNPKELSKSGQ